MGKSAWQNEDFQKLMLKWLLDGQQIIKLKSKIIVLKEDKK
ncbi:hypothetical protein [Klebsiella quasipneumoniae]|nr:hypothetical protein [Klebsiella quasipneumoniae]